MNCRKHACGCLDSKNLICLASSLFSSSIWYIIIFYKYETSQLLDKAIVLFTIN